MAEASSVQGDSKSPQDRVLDIVVFAPVGLALTAAEEFPRLASKGRARLGSQATMLKMVGQFAVSIGRQELARSVGQVIDQGRQLLGMDGSEPSGTGDNPYAGSAMPEHPIEGSKQPMDESASAAQSTISSERSGGVARSSGVVVPVPSVEALSIPGYNALSASQVVQRLDGLNLSERDAIRRYELATRGRRTILNRIDQIDGRKNSQSSSASLSSQSRHS